MTRWKDEYHKAADQYMIDRDLVASICSCVRPRHTILLANFGNLRQIGKTTAALTMAAACEQMCISVLVLTTNMNEASRLDHRLRRHVGRPLKYAKCQPRGAIETRTEDVARGFRFRMIIHDYYGEMIKVDRYNMWLLHDARHVILSQNDESITSLRFADASVS
jgi:hypothetical protein